MLKNIGWAKAYLGGIRDCRKWVDIHEEKLKRLGDDLTRYGVSDGGADTVRKTVQEDTIGVRVVDYIVRVNRIKDVIRGKLLDLYERQDEAEARIMQLKPGKSRDVLYDHYIRGISFGELTDLYGYIDPKTIYKVHDRALRYFEVVANREGWKNN